MRTQKLSQHSERRPCLAMPVKYRRKVIFGKSISERKEQALNSTYWAARSMSCWVEPLVLIFRQNSLFFIWETKVKKSSDKTMQKQPTKPKTNNTNHTESLTYEAPVEYPVNPHSFANSIFFWQAFISSCTFQVTMLNICPSKNLDFLYITFSTEIWISWVLIISDFVLLRKDGSTVNQ